ncbi:MAG: hypothetical protein HYX42_03215 [Polaromonas sp.]|uniref:hypothetical protein n=1 Tax=Polaromonas sp. TaxID=1869339 RepID=UPI0025D210A0|nr:hypothetical protein [Polaromonas sp.]MBI2725240.1 hypothetical protein [Polaromonas sp.]
MSTNRQKVPWHLVFLVLGALIGPGSVLLSGRDRWDGVIGDYLIQSNKLVGLSDWLQDSGWWLLWGLMRGLAWLVHHAGVDYWITLKIVIAAIMGWIAWETFRLAKDVFRMDEVQACWAAALTLVFPGYVLFHASCHVGVGLFLVFALLGYRMTLGAGPWRMAAGLVLIGLSFQMNSNLVLVPALELARWVLAGRTDRADRKRFLGLLAVAVAGYFFWKLVVGTGGVYSEAGYNHIVWPVDMASIKKLLVTSVLWASWLPLLLLGPVVWLACRAGFPRGPAEAAATARQQLLAGLLLCGAAVLAYIAAGKAAPFFVPTVFGTGGSVYATFAMEFRPGNFFSGLASPQIRHTILLGPMLSISMVAACIYVARRFPSARIAPAAALSLMLGVTWVHQSGWALWAHHEKLVQGALDQSVVNALKKLPPPPDGASILIERRQPQLQKDWTGTLETNFMLYEAYGRAAWIADTVFAPTGPSHGIALALLEENKAGFLRWAPKKDIRIFHIADDFTDSRCTAGYVFELAKPGAMDLLWRMPFAPASVAPATLVSSSRQCPKV